MNSSLINLKKILTIVVALAVILAFYEVGYGVYISQTTGLLVVNSSTIGTTITINQTGKAYENIGSTSARVRLKPGAYTVIASTNRNQGSQTVQIHDRQTTSIVLKVASTSTSQQKAQTPGIVSANQLISELLPYTAANNEYKINYFYEISNNIAVPTITVTYTNPSAKADATAWLNGLGFNTSVLNIQYIIGPVVN